MDIVISLPQEDRSEFSLLVSAIGGVKITGCAKGEGKSCDCYGEGFMVNYSLLIPLTISVPEPSGTYLNTIKNQIKKYLSEGEKVITVTNFKGDKILFHSPLTEQSLQRLDDLMNSFLGL